MTPLAFQQWVIVGTLALQLIVGIAIGWTLATTPLNRPRWIPTPQTLRAWRNEALRTFYGRLDIYKTTRPPRDKGKQSRPLGGQVDLCVAEGEHVEGCIYTNEAEDHTPFYGNRLDPLQGPPCPPGEYRSVGTPRGPVEWPPQESYAPRGEGISDEQLQRMAEREWCNDKDPARCPPFEHTHQDKADELPEDYSVVAVTGPEHVRPPEAEWQTDERGELVHPKSYPPMKQGLPRTPEGLYFQAMKTHECTPPPMECGHWTHWYGLPRTPPVGPIRRDTRGLYDDFPIDTEHPGPLHIPEAEWHRGNSSTTPRSWSRSQYRDYGT